MLHVMPNAAFALAVALATLVSSETSSEASSGTFSGSPSHGSPALGGPFDAGRVAPSLAGVTWHTEPKADGAVIQRQVNSGEFQPKRPDGQGYPAWHGFPVLVLAIPEGVSPEVLAFAERVARANDDRGLVVVTVSKAPPAPPAPAADAEGDGDGEGESPAPATTPPPEFTAPSAALVAGTAEESSPWCPDAAPRAIVLGPSGEVVGAVRLMAEEPALLELLADALNRYPALPLEEDLGDAVREPQARYFAGEWDAARKAAEKLAKKLERTDVAGAEAARTLARKVDEHERALRATLLELNGAMFAADRLAAVVGAIRRGFPRSKAAEEAEAAAELQLKDMSREVPFRVAEAWFESLPERPALFPEVADAAGKKYAKRLEALTKMATFDGDLTRRAKSLLLRFELAARR